MPEIYQRTSSGYTVFHNAWRIHQLTGWYVAALFEPVELVEFKENIAHEANLTLQEEYPCGCFKYIEILPPCVYFRNLLRKHVYISRYCYDPHII